MNRFGLIVLLALGNADLPAAEVYQDLRGHGIDVRLFRLEGPDTRLRIKTEPRGLRITVPADAQSASGFGTLFPIKGDFEITVGYEILEAERALTGSGVGLEIYVNTETPAQDTLVFYRVARPKEGDVYVCDRKVTDEKGNRLTKRKHFETSSKSGRLRLTRKGTEATFAAAEGADDEFRDLCRHEFTAEDLKGVHVRAFPGRSNKLVDIRISDIRIRASSSPEVTAELTAPSRTRLWVLIGGGGGLALIALGIWWRLARKQASSAAKLNSAGEATAITGDPAL